MGPEIHLLAERNGWLYIKNISTSWAEPKQITLWWPIGVHSSEYTSRFPCPHMPLLTYDEHIGHKMQRLGDGFFTDECDMTYRLKDGGATQPDWIETIDIAPPKQRGRTLPLRWYQGEWQKETAVHGWVRVPTVLQV